MKRDLPAFYIDDENVMQTCRRSRRAKFYRRMYHARRIAVIAVPIFVAAIGFGAYVWNEHTWRQRTAADQVELTTLRSQVQTLRDAIAVPKVVCRYGTNGRESCIKVHRGV